MQFESNQVIWYGNCKIGTNYWKIRMLAGYKLIVEKYVSESWEKIEHKNGLLIEDNYGLAETTPNISIMPNKGKILLRRMYIDKTAQFFEFDTKKLVWRKRMKYGVNHHSRFTSDHLLYSNQTIKEDSCLVGDDLWVIRKPFFDKFRIDKFDSNSKTWINIDYKNGHLLDHTTDNNYLLLAYKNQLFMLHLYSTFTQLLELDLKTLEWKKLRDIRNIYMNEYHTCVMSDRKLYAVSHFHMVAICLKSAEVTNVELPKYHDGIKDLCETNGKLFLITTHSNGLRIVYEYDEQMNMFTNIKKEQFVFLNNKKNAGYRSWAIDNKIYQSLNFSSGAPLRIDCFDVVTHEWHHVFQVDDIPFTIMEVYGNDNTIYVKYYRDDFTAFREMSLIPTLETVAMGQLADIVAYSRTNEENIRLPLGLKEPFVNMLAWKYRDHLALVKRIIAKKHN